MTAGPRPGLRVVEPYTSAQHDVTVRLNTNESPYPLPEDFAADLAAAIPTLRLHRYPDGQARRLREELASRTGRLPECLWAANGSNEILAQLLSAYGGPGRTAMTFEPTYVLHARLCWLTHTRHVTSSMTPPFVLGSSEVDRAASVSPDVIFVCSPNNPTGNAQPVEAIDALAAALPGSLIVVDEAYIEFGGATALPIAATRSNVVIVRTFSKAFSLAGARIGYCIGHPDVVEDLQRVRLPYHLSSLTQAAGLAALRHAREALSILDAVCRERDRLLAALREMPGLEAFPSDANFVLFRPSGRRAARDVWKGLLERGVLIRDLTTVVPEGLRVTAGTTHEVDAFLTAMREVLA
jgi:histidinol-phosphate aminotransferase